MKNITSLICFVVLLSAEVQAQSSLDSLHAKLSKHYFNTVLSIDAYRKPERKIADQQALSKKLKTYGIRQLNIACHMPLVTTNGVDDKGNITNTHLLLTASLYSFRPQFAGIADHNLVKFGVGARYIINTGKKGVWFVDVSPFVTKDVSYNSMPYYRLASTIIYSRNVRKNFNWRLGLTKSFLWGNRLYLPFIGLRFGELNKTNFSIQFPRNISLNIPVSEKAFLSIYSLAQGGMFNFTNRDSIYFRQNENSFHFARYEINTGLRLDYKSRKFFGFYVATGLSTRNTITLYGNAANKTRNGLNYNKYFYTARMPASLFFNLGLVFRFGKVRSSYGDKNIADAADLMDAPGGNLGNTLQLPEQKIINKLNLESVEDLVDYDDF